MQTSKAYFLAVYDAVYDAIQFLEILEFYVENKTKFF